MSPKRDSTLKDLKRMVADLRRELAERTTERDEAIAQQAATSSVLKTLSRSSSDLQPVLDALTENAARLCDAGYAAILRRDGEVYRIAAAFALTAEMTEAARNYRAFLEQHPLSPGRGSITGRVAFEGRVVHVADTAVDPEYQLIEASTLGQLRTQLGVPLLRDGELIGVMILARQRVEPFTQRQIELVETFADQAVIAIENARLIADTHEALEQQIATAEVLAVINSSPGDLAPVFDAILEKAHTLCDAAHGHLTIYDGEQFRAVAVHGVPPRFAEMLRQPFRPGLEVARRLLAGESVIHIPDMAALNPSPDNRIGHAAVALGHVRTLLIIPLRKDGALLGYLTAHREDVRPFTDEQIALLQSFAAQAVIAMENARLMNETREALEQQTATAEVLGVINSSPGDLAPVFDAMLEKALNLCEATFGNLLSYDGKLFHVAAAAHGDRGVTERYRRRAPFPVPPGRLSRIVETTEDIVFADDVAHDLSYRGVCQNCANWSMPAVTAAF